MAARNGTTGQGSGSGRTRKAKSKPRAKPKGKPGIRRKTKSGASLGKRAMPLLPALGRRLAIWTAWTAFAGFAALVGAVSYFAQGLPDIDTVRQTDRAPSITMLAGSGEVFARFGGLYAEAVALDQLPDHLLDAVLATEDRRFHAHFGVDMTGLARAAWANWRAGRVVQGGSTITQQLAKNLFLTADRTLERKLREAVLALSLERRFSKDQILELYLNRVYLGAGTYGVAAAARKYFGKPATDLTLSESAMMAGLLKAPSRYAPTRDLALAQARADQVLVNMVAADRLSEAAAAAARRRPATLAAADKMRLAAAYFADWVLEEVAAFVGRSGRNLTVITTLDPNLQRIAERALVGALARHGAAADIGQGAIVALAPDGAVQAMVGGRDHVASQFNRATQARRQPGSAFKPFVYLAGLEAGLAPDDRIVDSPVVVDGWRPRNYSGRHVGPVSLTEALARSINSVAVKIAEQAGREQVTEVAYRLGITSELRDHPSIALGTSEVSLLELSSAYVPFANGGLAVLPYGIVEIRNADGTVLYRRAGSGLGRVIEPGHAAQMNRMLAAVLDGGTGKAARLGRPAAGKTGTSQDFRDAWFIGYTPALLAGVWLGNDNATPMRRVTGGGLPALVWRDFMSQARDSQPVKPLIARASETRPKTRSLWQRLFGTPDTERSDAKSPTAKTSTSPVPKRARDADSDGGP